MCRFVQGEINASLCSAPNFKSSCSFKINQGEDWLVNSSEIPEEYRWK